MLSRYLILHMLLGLDIWMLVIKNSFQSIVLLKLIRNCFWDNEPYQIHNIL